MKKATLKLFAPALLLVSAGFALAEVHYVDVNSTNATPPYTNWATAAANIQDAVDAAVAGDEVVVTNGTYATGGRTVYGTMTNRVAVDKPLTLRSVNGPQFTVIQGFQVPGTTNGDGAIRCAYLTNGASLSGFTLTNGATRWVYDYPTNRESSGGGVWCESTNSVTISNCVVAGNSAYWYAGGAYGGTLHNCTLTANWGGGAYQCALRNCTLTSNLGAGATFSTLSDCTLTGNYGCGAALSTLSDCTLSGNSASEGGGAYGGTLNNCTLSRNSAEDGGGAYNATLNNCTLSGNSASSRYGGFGGGAYNCILNNCTLTGNTASGPYGGGGGGAFGCTLNNCTVTGNSASGPRSGDGGGASHCVLNNCIVYFNSAPNYGYYSILNYCCTTPQPTGGVGNISSDPQLASSSHLSAASPCRGAGNAAYASGTDIDGEAWLSPPSIGCDEYHASAVTGPFSVSITASRTNVLIGFAVQFTGAIEGRTTASSWDFGDGITVTNQPYTSHAWSALGAYAVVLRAYNGTQPDGISATVTVHVVNGVHYVAADSTNPVAPYASWATAATNIQDAVTAVEPGGPVVVVVSNGNYAPVAASGPVTLRSVNGPLFTTINGGGSNLCVSLADGASLSGFALTNGAGGASGGALSNCTLSGNASYGASSSTLKNCALVGNSSLGAISSTLNNSTITGNTSGGASGCTLNNCAIAGNAGVGATFSTLTNCTLTGNSGGGASFCTVHNCIVYFNTAAQGANYDSYSPLDYCCTTPQPTNGVGNISSDPQLASAWHLSAGSPCRGSGNADYSSGTDIDGEAWNSPPSIGCDEYHAGALTGPLNVAIAASFTRVLIGFTVQLTAVIEGRATEISWDFGDGIAVTNQPYTAHAWAPVGDYAVVLRAYNESQPGGISATVTVHAVDGIHYVAADSTNPVAPYASWATAATNIQDAINVVEAGGPLAVVVTSGNYAPVAASGSVAVRSVNGPLFTIINGAHSNLCASLTDGASLSGFTLTNGTGGASGGSLTNCTLTGNSWYGARSNTLNNCILTASGQGALYSTLTNCTLTGNSYGATSCTLNNCNVFGNTYSGVYGCTLNSCALVGNSGVGASSSGLTNCTLIGNSGGGASGCTLNNCIVYFNTAANGVNYDYSSTLNYCCATPQPTNGVGNISSDPQLVSSSHLSAGSPCRGAGNAAYSNGTDIDGEPWLSPPSIGCDEYYVGALTGPLTVAIAAPYTNVLVGYAAQFLGLVEGRAAATSWDFGEGTIATNQPLTAHAWTAVGDYTVVLRAYNQTQPGATSATITVHVVNGLHYVVAGSTNPVAPYTSWATAATSIQEAISAAEPGASQVLVTDGIYSPIYIPALMTVRSINGPQFTIINGGGGSRCANLATNAILSGFTLSNGYATDYGGGAHGGTLTNCTLAGNVAEAALIYSYFCASYDPRYHFCRLIAAGYSIGDAYGGGAAYCTLNNCTLAGNVVEAPLLYNPNGNGYQQIFSSYSLGSAYGGGAAFCTLNNCTLTNNLAQEEPVRYSYYDFIDNGSRYGREAGGGGVYSCTLTNCALSNNRVQGNQFFVYDDYDDYGYYIYAPGYAGGALDSTLDDCNLTGHSGQAAYSCTLRNCALTGNSGPGAIYSRLNNCTLTGNSSGAYNSTLSNSIVYFNGAANYDSSSTLNYCCTTPQPTNGVGNISADPQLASASHLSFLSPCIGKGNPAAASGLDIDGEPWADPPSMGCDELHVGTMTGPLSAAITASLTNVTAGYPVAFTALIQGRTDLSLWSFGDGAVEINQPYVTHSWSATGDYLVSLWCFNDTYPDGVSSSMTVHVVTGVHYVAADSASPSAPFTSWATAATNIQDAINAVEPGGAVVVTNGIYAPIHASGALSVRSVNGAAYTIIDGGRSNLCASLAAVPLSGFTLTNGAGGASGGTLNSCILVGNSGSAASGGTLNNCALTANSGVGASYSTLNNCTLTGNSGGGVSSCALNNCITCFNAGTPGGNYDSSSTLNYCCTTPQPTNGVGNISSDPKLASACRLSAASPCRGVGNAAYAIGTDIDGEAWANPPSMGCDEYHAGALTGPLSADIAASLTNVAVGFVVNLTGSIGGRCAASSWDFGDGTTTTNQAYTSHAWAAPGDYAVVLRAYNESQPGGISATVTVHVVTGVHYVAAASTNPVAPFTSWATAATNIQDAVDAAVEPGAVVMVTNGIYAAGGRAVNGTTNRLAIHTLLTVRSVNGPQFTTIDGVQSVRCAYLTNGATLSGFTLTNGLVAGYGSSLYGGGAFCESANAVISNCVVTGNSARGQYDSGGGAYGGTLNQCTLTGNLAYQGGGAYGSALNNCTLSANVSYSEGGGVAYCTLNNCTLSGNSGRDVGGAASCTLNNCSLTGNWAFGHADYGGSGGGNGGGAGDCTLNNCTLVGNWCYAHTGYGADGGYGGGAVGGTLNNCTLVGNWCYAHTGYGADGGYGGGAVGGTLNNCTLSANSATHGGGASGSILNNCTLTGNSAADAAGALWGTLNNCIVLDGVSGSTLNFCWTADPLFASGTLRLQSNSPCINGGNNAYAVGSTDLDGNPRIAGGTVDIGAYEFQGTGLSGFTAWLWQYGLPIDGSARYADADGDGMNNWQEWIAGTNPTNATSVLRLLAPVPTPPGLLLSWNGDTNHEYFVERTTSLGPPLTFSRLRSNVPGVAGITTFIDPAPPAAGKAFYRIGTDSTSGSSPLWLETPAFVPASVVVSWTSVSDRSYFLERSTGLTTSAPFTLAATNIPGQSGTTSYADTNAVGRGPFFYRVGVGN